VGEESRQLAVAIFRPTAAANFLQRRMQVLKNFKFAPKISRNGGNFVFLEEFSDRLKFRVRGQLPPCPSATTSLGSGYIIEQLDQRPYKRRRLLGLEKQSRDAGQLTRYNAILD